MSSLFVIRGRDQGKRFELGRESISIGRDSENTIQLYDTEISRFHAEIRSVEDDFHWVDLGSSNGSFVNSFRSADHKLRSGDRVQIGRTLMIFTASSELSATMSSDEVDIIGSARSPNGSRIIKSVSHEEGSQILSGTEIGGGPWLARVRSNLQIMYRTALAVSHTLDIDQLLERIMELIFEWVEADRGCVMLADRDSDKLVPRVRRDRRDATLNDKLEISQTILDYVQAKQEGVLTSNAREDERWDPGASIVKLGVREAICVPMQGRYDMVGVIYIDTFTPPEHFIHQPARNKFNEEHLKLMVAIGHQAALAVEDTSYYSAMVQAERLAAVGQTIAGLSHHIKNILQGIRGGSYLIEEGLKANDNDVTRKGWSIVEKNQERISRLVMDMLTFSKERKPDLTPSDLNQVVQEVVDLMNPRAVEQQLVMEFKKGEIPTMSFDAEGIHRAVLNVVTNAIDACEQDDRIVMRTEYDESAGLLRVFIEDTGSGIASEKLTKIFTVFESDKGNRGTGLGLAVSQKIAREHGGDIHVTSQPDEGSRFVIEFPAIPPETSS